MSARDVASVITGVGLAALLVNVLSNARRTAELLESAAGEYAAVMRRITRRPGGRGRVSLRRGAITYATRDRRRRLSS